MANDDSERNTDWVRTVVSAFKQLIKEYPSIRYIILFLLLAWFIRLYIDIW